MDFRELQDAVLSTIPQHAWLGVSNVRRWLNEAQLDVAQRIGLLQETDTEVDLAESGNLIPLPADFLEFRSLLVGTDDDVEIVDHHVWESYFQPGIELNHTIARFWEGNLELYPAPEAGTALRLRFLRKPAVLDLPTDIPEIPEHLQAKLIYFARAQAYMAIGELDVADRHQAVYERGLPTKGVDRQFADYPMQIIPVAGPFDRDPGARHI